MKTLLYMIPYFRKRRERELQALKRKRLQAELERVRREIPQLLERAESLKVRYSFCKFSQHDSIQGEAYKYAKEYNLVAEHCNQLYETEQKIIAEFPEWRGEVLAKDLGII